MGEKFNNLPLGRNVLWKIIITIIVTDTTFVYGLIQKDKNQVHILNGVLIV